MYILSDKLYIFRIPILISKKRHMFSYNRNYDIVEFELHHNYRTCYYDDITCETGNIAIFECISVSDKCVVFRDVVSKDEYSCFSISTCRYEHPYQKTVTIPGFMPIYAHDSLV